MMAQNSSPQKYKQVMVKIQGDINKFQKVMPKQSISKERKNDDSSKKMYRSGIYLSFVLQKIIYQWTGDSKFMKIFCILDMLVKFLITSAFVFHKNHQAILPIFLFPFMV